MFEVVAVATDAQEQTLIGVVGIMAVAMAGALTFAFQGWREARKGAQQATQANAAVNNVGPGEHRLFDKVSHIAEQQSETHAVVTRLEEKQEEFDKKGWPSLPPDINTAAGLTEVIRQLQHENADHQRIISKIESMEKEIRDHVVWEMSQKYPDA